MTMDSHGVPQKINRHVFKAVHYFSNQKNGSSFPEIYNYVKYCNKNLMPVSNLKDIVRKSLNNLHRVGLVQKDHLKFKIRTGIPAKKSILKKKNAPATPSKESTQPDQPSRSKKRKTSDTSVESDVEKSATKRLRGGKKKAMEERKGKKADLPRARRHQGGGSNVPINSASMGAASDSKVGLDGQDEDEKKMARGISNEDSLLTENEEVYDDETSNARSCEASEETLNKHSGDGGASHCHSDAIQNPNANDPDNNSAIN